MTPDLPTWSSTGRAGLHGGLHKGSAPKTGLGQGASGRSFCGVEPGGGRCWAYNSGGLYQVDAHGSGAWQLKAFPTNVVATQGVRVVVPEAGWPGAGKMYMLAFNNSTSRFELYSAPLVSGANQPVWTGPLLSLQTNAILIATGLRATSAGVFVAEYSGASDIAAGPNVYRSTNGTDFATVIDADPTTRHFHAVYEDPFNLGEIWVTAGDGVSPYAPANYVYRSTDGGATFAGVAELNAATWQTVGMGFTEDAIWFASDQVTGGGAYVLDRDDPEPRWASLLKHDRIAVPGGHSRTVTDLTTTNGSDVVTSATAAFTTADVGREISGPNTIPAGAYITAVTNATTVTISQNATGAVAATATIKDSFYVNAYAGAVDPDSGWFYVVANDTSAKGSVVGLFIYTEPGAAPILWETIHHAAVGNSELLIEAGKAWIGRYGPIVLAVAAEDG